MTKLLLLITLFLAATVAMPYYGKGYKPLAPLVSSPGAETIPDQYIVVFKSSATAERITCHHNDVRSMLAEENRKVKRGFMSELISGIKHYYDIGDFQGYSGKFSYDVLNKIRESDDVAYVERDQKVYPTVLQRNAPWGLARISHRKRLESGTFTQYTYDDSAGEGVTAYVIDTGVNINHVEFGGRAEWGTTIPNEPDDDEEGHGTHVAGTIAGSTYGVAKKAKIVAVKVLGPNGGTTSDVIKGIEWTVNAHKRESSNNDPSFKGSVANMSLGGSNSAALDASANAAVDAGVVLSVAAGNDAVSACTSSPASAEKAITVAASTIEDARASFSNYGECVDIFAPGKDILSAWIGSDTATNTISGTSMATPHITGLSAYILGLSSSPMTPQQVLEVMLTTATPDAISDVGPKSPNLLAFNNYNASFHF
ncbi:7363_t:CDS:2 [Paraglomus occultum]|uniref:7363_t:CDS:1 n=1 Tax=Paraglomus occultum TaxID=144539 RepID=A0A9N9C9W3_9GLOM|nr:7363_t:CDS:2 [Paraglomus occultum]